MGKVQDDTQRMDVGSKEDDGARCRVYYIQEVSGNFSKKKVTEMSNFRRMPQK